MSIELISSIILVGTLFLLLYAYFLLKRTQEQIGLVMMHIDGMYAKIRKNSRLSALEQTTYRQKKISDAK